MKKFHDLDLYNYNTYKIHSIAKNVFFPENYSELTDLVINSGKKYNLIGNGSNIILSKKRYEEDFIVIRENFSAINVSGELIVAESGAILKDIAEIALINQLSGLEMFYDIPGTIGGAVVMNAGACGEVISDIISDITFLDLKTGKIRTVLKKDLSWGYRKSDFQEGVKIVTLVTLKLKSGTSDQIKKKMSEILEKRHFSQPWDQPSAGSVFKRPDGHYVGKMIEELGLKGYCVGGMKISEKHAGFIVNTGNGTGQDVLDIVRFVKEKVKEKYNVDLKLEQVVI